jgi:hypothetical protein
VIPVPSELQWHVSFKIPIQSNPIHARLSRTQKLPKENRRLAQPPPNKRWKEYSTTINTTPRFRCPTAPNRKIRKHHSTLRKRDTLHAEQTIRDKGKGKIHPPHRPPGGRNPFIPVLPLRLPPSRSRCDSSDDPSPGACFDPAAAWKRRLYVISGLLGPLALPVAGVIVSTGDSDLGDGVKLNALERTEGVAGWDVEPYGQLGIFLLLNLRNCEASVSDSSVSLSE